jgi:hypothetical protein
MDENDDESGTGRVQVFNTAAVGVKLTLNGNQLKSLPPAAGRDGNYAASSISVRRSDAVSIDDPVFAQQNSLTVRFPGTSNNYPSVSIDPIVSSTNNDLLLYIFYGYMLLVDGASNSIIVAQSPS